MMETPLFLLPIHRPEDEPKASSPESQLSSDILVSLVQDASYNSPENLLEAVERLIVDIRGRVLADTDPEAAEKLGELLTYEKYLQGKGVEKAA